ncbi:TetR/AcrR family transcriptional regulator [Spirulina sp. CS-785/01]|uniref:TetR/AcrR family transcriptional regulator n=1 Tax=Spirulina sp. CS-785/01 TaxID=3021716 RepID=UPI00232BAF2B|nr:TetR/AcrR family transcriptional regulator [Spirulina sp. CS-785/01]MDB9311689.1 TetR/AcrR family transcriptional regulator [Spirulina sp. CS-785/01]
MSPILNPHPTKREQILNGATEIFLQQGYEGASMDRVAAQAGVSKNTIYSHFQDKEGLFKATIEQVTEKRFQIIFGSLTLSNPPATVLREIAEKILEMVCHDDEYIAFLRLIVGESGRFPELAQKFLHCLPHKVLNTLTQYLAQQSDLHLSHPEATARIFMGTLMGYIMTQKVLHGETIIPMEQQILIDNLIEIITA